MDILRVVRAVKLIFLLLSQGFIQSILQTEGDNHTSAVQVKPKAALRWNSVI